MAGTQGTYCHYLGCSEDDDNEDDNYCVLFKVPDQVVMDKIKASSALMT